VTDWRKICTHRQWNINENLKRRKSFDNVNDPWRHCAKWKCLVTPSRNNSLSYLYKLPKIVKLVVANNRIMPAKRSRGWENVALLFNIYDILIMCNELVLAI
jgi:hypothetical protein